MIVSGAGAGQEKCGGAGAERQHRGAGAERCAG